jgi:DNA-binding response OmpR family regulator
MPGVLLIHPDQKLMGIYRRHLEPHFRVDSAHDGLTGLRMIRQMRPRVIVSNVDLPYVSGLALLSHVRSHPEMSATPFLFLTDALMPDDALGLGASAWLRQKDHGPEQLLPHIASHYRLHLANNF